MERSRPANGTLVETYLWSRLLCIDAPATIRLRRSLRHKESGQRRPAMVGLVEHTEFGPVGIHATYLAIDGSCKATLDPVRKSWGPVGGGAVRLAPIGTDGVLVVGEGIETTLSLMIATGAPGWAALFADNLAKLVPPPEARRIVIAADHDANGTGQRAAQHAALRFRQQGRSVRVCIPPVPGDYNDILACRIPAMGGPRHAA